MSTIRSISTIRTFLAGAALLTASSLTHAAGITLGGLPYYTYGNGNSYTMPISADAYASINGGGTGPGNPYYVPSSPGQIQDLVVIFTGASGTAVATPVTGLDNAHQTPGGGGPQLASLSGAVNVTPTDTLKGGLGNNANNTWDASLLAMKTLLAGGDPLFLSNHNDMTADQSLAIWARMWLTDSAGITYGRDLYLSSQHQNPADGAGGALIGDATSFIGSGAAPAAVPTAQADQALSGGTVCSNGLTVVACMGPSVATAHRHNLGTSLVAYAGDVPLLNQWLSTLFAAHASAQVAGYSFHMDLKMGCDPSAGFPAAGNGGMVCPSVQIDNGYEQLFLTSANPLPMPAPAVLSLERLDSVGVALSRRRIAA